MNNNSNPFVPQGSLLEQQSKRRSRMKLGVLCVLVVGVAGLTAMLIQGCKREQNNETENQPPVDTNTVAMDTNTSPMEASNPPVVAPPVAPPVMTPVEVAGAEYVVVKGDTLGKIAKKNGISLKALETANPGVAPTKLKVGQKLTIPAGGPAAPAVNGGSASVDTGMGGETYVVKSGDTLTKIAKAHGTTVKAIETANGLSTTKITVGKKLKIPAKAEAAAPAPVAPAPAPMPPPTTPPAPASPPSGQ